MKQGTYDININAYDKDGERTGFDIYVDCFDTKKEAIEVASKFCSVADIDLQEEDPWGLFHPEDGEYLQVEVNYVCELEDWENENADNFEYGPVLYKCRLTNN